MFALERVISLVAPLTCVVCNKEGLLLCDACAEIYCPALPARCYRCYTLSRDAAVCSSFRYRSPLKHVWVRTEYNPLAKRLVYDFKFDRIQAGATTIAGLMLDPLPYLPRDTLVVPIPTATSRQRQRGYDHAALLTRELAKHTELSYVRALVRLGQSRQVGANKQALESQLSEAFRVTSKERVQGRRIVLVDDIVTTGASLEAAAKVLKAAGAKRIDALVFAQRS